jgi:hypothetical protein
VAAHLSSRHKKWPAIFHNCYPVPKITILVSAHLRDRYQKARRSLVSVVLRQPLLIMYYWYHLVSPPILVSATVISRYQYWIQGVILNNSIIVVIPTHCSFMSFIMEPNDHCHGVASPVPSFITFYSLEVCHQDIWIGMSLSSNALLVVMMMYTFGISE